MAHFLDPFFNPKSVAVVGATEAAQKIAGRRWKTLVEGGFTGNLYPIHPHAGSIRGYPAFRSLRDVPGPVELAVVVVPSDTVARVAQDCIDIGIGAMVLISGGFGESGSDGKVREVDLVTQMRAAGIRMVGPNCAGLASLPAGMNITGFEIPAGRVGLISQSGNLALNLSFLAKQAGGGFSRQVTIGNTADLGVVEFTEYLLQDPETDVVLIYLEGWRDGEGRQLIDIVTAGEPRKPIVILNPGGTQIGRRAAFSHTGALAASDQIAAGAYRQAGIIQVHGIEEAWLVARSLCELPSLGSANLAILSDGGGHATLVCDALDRAGLRVPPFSEGTRQRLAQQLPKRCAIDNPVDFAGLAETEPAEISPVLDICLSDPDIGGAMLVGHFGGYHTIGGDGVLPAENGAAEALINSMQAREKPFLVHSTHGRRDLSPLMRLRDGGIPVTDSIPVLAAVASGLVKATPRKSGSVALSNVNPVDNKEVDLLLSKAVISQPRWLMEPEARDLLRCFKVDVPEFETVTNRAECAEAVTAFGGSVALKRIAPDTVHKSSQGGVLLNIGNPEAAKAAFDFLMSSGQDEARVLVTPMIATGIEIVIGGARDRQFGPVVMLGLGGVGVEVLKDVTFRPTPISSCEAVEMFGELRSRGLFFTEDGNTTPGVDAASKLVAHISSLMAVRPEFAEIDLNPVFLREEGPRIADVRVVLT